MRGSIAKRNRDRSYMWKAILLAFVVIAAVCALFIWKVVGTRNVPTDLLCPSQGGPTAHVILLVDKTDPLTFTQGKAFRQILEDFAKFKYVREGELVSVFVLGEDFRQTADPIFEKCNPGDGKDRSKITENPELWKRKYENEYYKPIMALESQLQSLAPAKYSPILEMLQLVSLRFAKYDVRGRRSLYIVSDMLHNTRDFSLYGDLQDYGVLKRQPFFARLRSQFSSTDMNIFLLMNTPQFQTRKLSKFWEDYIKEMGGTLQQIEPLPG